MRPKLWRKQLFAFPPPPQNPPYQLLLVDDASSDNTAQVARSLNIKTHVHSRNIGYGGNQKTCYKLALAEDADIVVMLHPDGQYDPGAIPALIRPILQGYYEAAFGSRMSPKTAALSGGMPWWKFLANILLTDAANLLLGTHFSELHCGFRAYRAQLLRAIPYERFSDGFDFDIQMTLALLSRGFRIHELPIATRYFPEASSINFRRSLGYGFNFLRHVLAYQKTLFFRPRLPHSAEYRGDRK